eukprot:TRINITY_DN13834_c0_g1_i1.p1 TRINITY_DN13834_c0_g1~~TRINITY_DN13834_c0_g1_i1.p1  ORF type:complete len:492 (+),score=133.59 TRINITY_DN13834_c0_g1_i1:104-1579(+)
MNQITEAKRTGGYFKDKAKLAATRVQGNEIERAILKTTSHKLKPPNEKHLARLQTASFDPKVAQEIVAGMESRVHNHEWVVVLKALVVLHTLMKNGNEAVKKEITKKSSLFHVSRFKELWDKASGSHSNFICYYARYLEERTIASRSIPKDILTTATKSEKDLQGFTNDSALGIAEALTLQLKTLIEFNNFGVATLSPDPLWQKAMKLILQDSKIIYTFLANWTISLMERSKEFTSEQKSRALSNFRDYVDLFTKLSKMITTIQEISGDTSSPALKPLPDKTIKQVESFLSDIESPFQKITDLVSDISIEKLTITSEELQESPVSERPPAQSSSVVAPPQFPMSVSPPQSGGQLFTSSVPPPQQVHQQHRPHHQHPHQQQPSQQQEQQQPLQQQQPFQQQPQQQQQQLFQQPAQQQQFQHQIYQQPQQLSQPQPQQQQQQQPGDSLLFFSPEKKPTSVGDIWPASPPPQEQPQQQQQSIPAPKTTLDELFS